MAIFNAAVVQMRSTTEVERNLAALEQGVSEAAKAGAHYVQTPEMTGLVQQHRKEFFGAIVPQEQDRVVAKAATLARDLGITLHIGSTPIRLSDTKAANRAFVFGPQGDLLATYDKLHMFDVDLDHGERWRESAVYQPGESAQMVMIYDALAGLGICYDMRFPELAKAYGTHHTDILTFPSCFTRQTGQAHWHVLLRSRAIENGAFVVAAAQGGEHEDGRTTFGHSMIVNPWGQVIAEVQGEEPGFAVAQIDTTEVAAARSKVPNLKNSRPFTLQQAMRSKEAAA